jgi:polyphenol oxidase
MGEFDLGAARSESTRAPLQRWQRFESLGVDVAFTTRFGGTSKGRFASLNLGLHVGDDSEAVIENRRIAADAFGAPLDRFVFSSQVHGNRVAVVDQSACGNGVRSIDDALPRTDAVVTGVAGPVLAILVADCVPIVLVDPRQRVLACVHAGWRGTSARILDGAVEAMMRLGARPGDVVAGLGPAVAPAAYQVGTEVAEAVTSAFAGSPPAVLCEDGADKWRLDLVGTNHQLLCDIGINPERIWIFPATTGEHSPYFSDRAQRPCGRFALLARLRGDGP